YTTMKNLPRFRESLVRNYRLSNRHYVQPKLEIVSLLADEILQKVPEKEKRTGVRDGRTRLVPNMLFAYFDDMHNVIESCYRNLVKGGTMHIVVDQSSYIGVPIPTDTILSHIGEQCGFRILSVIKCRRAATSGQQLAEFPYLKSTLRESIVSFEKG